MDPLIIGYAAVIALMVALFAGLPVGVGMGMIGVAGMYLSIGPQFVAGQLTTLPFAVTSNNAYAVLPLFVLMGMMAEAAGVTGEIFEATDRWLRRLRGGLFHAVIVGSTVFAAICGSTVVGAVVFTRLAFPEMMKRGYSRSISLGCIAATGSFSAMIPPSITMVIYAIVTEQSLGRLLVAGIMPGILTAIVYLTGMTLMVHLRPSIAPEPTSAVPLADRLRTVQWLWPVFVLIVLVLGGSYFGFFPPSAAGAVGVTGTFLILLLRQRGRIPTSTWYLLVDAASVSCILFTILIGGLLFARMLVVAGVIDDFTQVISSTATSRTSFLIFAAILYLILGCFLDTTSMMIVTLPFIFPVTQQLGIDGIWFGILLVKLVEIAVLTPPVGFNLFAVMSVVGPSVPYADIAGGVLPFILLELIVLTLLIAFPEISTWLPNTLLGR